MSERKDGGGGAAGGLRREGQPQKLTPGTPGHKILSQEETCLQSLQFILDTKVMLPGSTSSNLKCLSLSKAELPISQQDSQMKLSHIFEKAASTHTHDKVWYCILCYDRTVRAPPKEWEPSMWSVVVQGTQEAAVVMLAAHLVASCFSAKSVWFDVDGGKRDICIFLEAVSGWEKDKQLPADMLKRIITRCSSTPEGRRVMVEMVSTVGAEVMAVKKTDEVMEKSGKYLNALSVLIAENEVVEAIAEALLMEVEKSDKGSYFNHKSVFSGLLSLSPVMDLITQSVLTDPKYSCFHGLQNFPNILVTDLINCHSHVQDSLHRCQSLVNSVLLKALRSKSKNNVLAWVSAVVSLNEQRAGPKFRRHNPDGVCSHGFMLNFCSVMLELCKPFFANSPSGPKLDLIAHSYTASKFCRLDMHNEPCLAGGSPAAEQPSLGYKKFLAEGSDIKFVTECFYITQRALHIGLIPAMETFIQTMSDLHKRQEISKVDEKVHRELTLLDLLHSGSPICPVLLSVLHNTSCVGDTSVGHLSSSNGLLQKSCVVVNSLLRSIQQEGLSQSAIHEAQKKRLQAVPEHCIKDMAAWFRFIVGSRPNLLQGLEITALVDCCVTLLERTDLLPGPVAQSKIISVLLSFINGHTDASHRQLLGADSWSDSGLSATVHASPTVRDHLGPALLHSYIAVSVVEGLDVDKENFDKYSARYEIAQLLQHLWSRLDCRESILRECSSKKFESFLGAIFDTLLYQFNDGLTRLANIRQIEQAKEDAAHWSSLSFKERQDKEQFLASEQHVGRGFLKLANFQLQLLLTMSESDAVSKCFCVPPLSIRTAAAMLGFLNSLCGPRATELKVKDRESYAFNPRKLIDTITTIVLRVWKQESNMATTKESNMAANGFMKSIALHPEYSADTMSHVGSLLSRDNQTSAQTFALFMQNVEAIQRASGVPQSSSSPQGRDRSPKNTRWQVEAKAIQVDQACLRDLYVCAMEPSKYDSAALIEVHTFADRSQTSFDARSPKVKAILRDMKQLQESLPIHPDSAIFVRQDEEHMDLVRVLITGPVDTPYSRGCFTFDVYYPNAYPTSPPLVVLITTANKTVRFNPNLYADGKVCLSLLGTWHGGDATEKWDPNQSSLFQVLLSIQGMILIPDPMFNEPGYEAIRGTEEGNRRSAVYNADLQVHTVRYAMLEQLRNPPAGFSDLIRAHFTIQRDIILKQCAQWLDKAVNTEHEQRLRRAIDEFRPVLEEL